ncbi:otoancorin-like [Lycorma delicatula]|uniref:otoancorin-like n=1 Tax=Lycorma delicatula TaxID=130591 RepID=UPI003F51A9E2
MLLMSELGFTAAQLLLGLQQHNLNYSFSCADIINAGSGAKLSENDLQSLVTITPSELQSCLVILGKDVLQPMRAEILWKVIVKVYGSADEIPENDLRLLGWIISGIPPSDFHNLSLSDVDTIAAFGQYRNLSRSQLLALHETVSYFWSYKDEADLSGFDLAALKQIICAFNASYIQYIHPDAYRDAASELAILYDCPKDVMMALARLAVDEAAFGDPKEWTPNKVAAVGCVISGLSNVQVQVIPPEAMKGLTSDIIKCLPSTTLQAMTKDQLSKVYSDSGKKAEAYQSLQKPTQYSTNFKDTYHSDRNVTRNIGFIDDCCSVLSRQ